MADSLPIVRLCEVLSIEDKTDCDRIKVKLTPEDNNKTSLDQIPYAIPLLPKLFGVKPKVGEAVLILTAIANDGNSQRYYIGPVITQKTHMEEEPYYIDAKKMFRGSLYTADQAPSMNPDTNGAFANDEDVTVNGRRNCDIQITPDDIRIRAGVRKSDPQNRRNVYFNSKDPAYVKLKYHEGKKGIGKLSQGSEKCASTATIVADKINILSHNGDACNNGNVFKLTDPQDLITDESMEEIITKAHQLPFGDTLIEFLKLFRNAFIKHIHPFPTLPPCPDSNIANLAAYDLDKILSKVVRIN